MNAQFILFVSFANSIAKPLLNTSEQLSVSNITESISSTSHSNKIKEYEGISILLICILAIIFIFICDKTKCCITIWCSSNIETNTIINDEEKPLLQPNCN